TRPRHARARGPRGPAPGRRGWCRGRSSSPGYRTVRCPNYLDSPGGKMRTVNYAMGIDVGTTNVKAALVSEDGTLIASAHRPLTMVRTDGNFEQDADAMWAQLVSAVSEVTAAHPSEAAAVVTLGICSQYSSIVAVDERAQPVAPILMWQDQRGTEHCFDIM